MRALPIAVAALLLSLASGAQAADSSAGNGTHRLDSTARKHEGSQARQSRPASRPTGHAGKSRRNRAKRGQPNAAPAPTSTPGSAPAPSQAPAPTPTPAPAPSPAPGPAPEPAPTPAPLLETGFENGLTGWNIAGVGDTVPNVVSDVVRSGSKSAQVLLTGSQGRSELILGGNGTSSLNGTVKFGEGDEYWYGFSFYIQSMVYGRPGAHNLILQLKGNDGGSPAFGLQLWDYAGDKGQYKANPKGLWSHGTGMGGDRFLAPAAERQWHDVAIHFKVSRVGAGFYEIYLDGKLVDSRTDTSILPSAASYAYIKDGLYRNGGNIPGTSELRIDAARLGTSASAVQPG